VSHDAFAETRLSLQGSPRSTTYTCALSRWLTRNCTAISRKPTYTSSTFAGLFCKRDYICIYILHSNFSKANIHKLHSNFSKANIHVKYTRCSAGLASLHVIHSLKKDIYIVSFAKEPYKSRHGHTVYDVERGEPCRISRALYIHTR